MPFVDVTAARMPIELRDDLARDGVRLVIARDVGQVRDILRRAGDPGDAVHPTLTAAVEAAARPTPDQGGAGDHGG